MSTRAITHETIIAKRVFLVALVGVLAAACGNGSSAGDQTTTSTPTSTTSEATITTAATGTTTSAAATTTVDEEDAPGERLTVEGVVIAVDGNLDAVASFTVRLSDGSDLIFSPDDGAQFDGGPIGHIREHLTSGAPVRVDFVVLGDGTNLAMDIGDA
jgi:ABC-type glycerol-3-phosphate transport system substrate-binding protein